MGVAYDGFVVALRRHGCRIFYDHGDAARAQCPGHESTGDALSVSEADRHAGIVIHCFRGCAADAVLGALGLTRAALFDKPQEPGSRPLVPSVPPPHTWLVAGGGYIPSVDHLMHRIAQEHEISEPDHDSIPPHWEELAKTNFYGPRPPHFSDDQWDDFCEGVEDLAREIGLPAGSDGPPA